MNILQACLFYGDFSELKKLPEIMVEGIDVEEVECTMVAETILEDVPQ